MRNLRRAGVSTLVAAALVFAATACGSGDADDDPPATTASSRSGGQEQGDAGGEAQQDDQPLATLKGDDGIEMVVEKATRDSGGFVTVSGRFRNTGSGIYTIPIQWSGEENAVAGTGRSVAAMTLVDAKDKKRYYVLRDTDNRPLTTAGFDPSIDAGGSLTFFAQFPSPPRSTTSVNLQFPGFPDATIELS